MDSTSEGIADKKNCKDAGRLINILSNQLKRHFLLPDADSGLTHMRVIFYISFYSPASTGKFTKKILKKNFKSANPLLQGFCS